ncbi:MAG TPA: hypothetical protein VLS27_18095 [Gammaproteobacteria bacterium]|nr:hypothetical protein [Gammaproteobacteria bacterium]
MKRRHRLQVILLALLVPTAASGAAETNFSQHPGFARYFADNPPVATTPSLEQRALLMRYRPRILVPEDHPGPIDFYRDYVAHGRLYDGKGNLVSGAVTQDLLNRFKGDPRAEFRHLPPNRGKSTPVIYARIDRAEVTGSSRSENAGEGFILLTYHAVFRHSGLPKGLQVWKAALLGVLGDLRDWHQLDHYTAVTVVLNAEQTPVAVMLQQHNYLRTYLVDEAIALPPDGRKVIDVAIRSNELYPHLPGRHRRRAARFADRGGMGYLMGFGARPLIAADDITESAREVEYALEYLPPSDAFYLFQGFLGERRLLPGRSGPPGASYNTLPEMKPLHVQLLSGYWREGNAGDWQRYRKAAGQGKAGFAAAQGPVFLHNLGCLRKPLPGCRLR